MAPNLEQLIALFKKEGIDQQIDYDKFYLYSIITHSTAIEGSTITELENQIMFDQGVSLKGKSIEEQNMNLDLKYAYEKAIKLAEVHTPITIETLKYLSSLVMKNTGKEYHTMLGDFSSSNGDLRLLNVTAGFGGRSYMNYSKVPVRLAEFCNNLNIERQHYQNKSINELYQISFDAHFDLVTIHPWADGNGRMARLLMNMLQFEFELIPTIILQEDKEDYIKALVTTREHDDISIFRKFMTDTMIKNLSDNINVYRRSIENDGTVWERRAIYREKKLKSREKIIMLLSENNKLTTAQLAKEIGITPKGVEKHLANLKADGKIQRIGPDKGGQWKVL